jgi:glycosyltransferase involved in cell wall biosynthesis
MLGLVPRADLDVLFENAETLVFPSRYEGFGLPVLEAQQCGLPVIASNAGALPEVAGDAATLLDPDDEGAWTEALCSPLEGDAHDAAIAAGIRNADRFTMETSATQQLSAYAQLAT